MAKEQDLCDRREQAMEEVLRIVGRGFEEEDAVYCRGFLAVMRHSHENFESAMFDSHS